MSHDRHEFSRKVIDTLKQRAAYICSNPDCRKMTIAPSSEVKDGVLYFGRAAHITAAKRGGPRYDSQMTEAERRGIDNGIYLCSNCADMIDDNMGADFEVANLKAWKSDHEKWIRTQLNKQVNHEGLAERVLTQLTGGDSKIYLLWNSCAFLVHFLGENALRDFSVSIQNMDVLKSRIAEDFIGDLYQHSQFIGKSVIFSTTKSSIHVSNNTSAFLTGQIAPITLGEKKHFRYRAKAMNGEFSGDVYLWWKDASRVPLQARVGNADKTEIHRFPPNYPTVGDGNEPDWDWVERYTTGDPTVREDLASSDNSEQ